jgi:hypothetical protein
MNYGNLFPSFNGTMMGFTGIFVAILVIWTLVWKGLALWRASRRNEPMWFVILLLVNTLGILEIVYYFFVAKSDKK